MILHSAQYTLISFLYFFSFVNIDFVVGLIRLNYMSTVCWCSSHKLLNLVPHVNLLMCCYRCRYNRWKITWKTTKITLYSINILSISQKNNTIHSFFYRFLYKIYIQYTYNVFCCLLLLKIAIRAMYANLYSKKR